MTCSGCGMTAGFDCECPVHECPSCHKPCSMAELVPLDGELICARCVSTG